MNVAVIPARGGSKRISRKNIRTFCGYPIIYWSIKSALESGCFERVIVSTDDKEIAQIACKFGAEAPFTRPAILSDDFATTSDVVRHAIEWLGLGGDIVESVCCLYATAPFVTPSVIRESYFVMQQSDAPYVFAATSYDYPVQRALFLNTSGKLEMLYPEYMQARSQDLKQVWHDAGQFYWGKKSAWLSKEPVFSSDSVFLEIPRYLAQDIDTEEDWLQAEMMYQSLKQRGLII